MIFGLSSQVFTQSIFRKSSVTAISLKVNNHKTERFSLRISSKIVSFYRSSFHCRGQGTTLPQLSKVEKNCEKYLKTSKKILLNIVNPGLILKKFCTVFFGKHGFLNKFPRILDQCLKICTFRIKICNRINALHYLMCYLPKFYRSVHKGSFSID